MRHGKKVAKLGRPADQRRALVRSLTTEVLRHGKIRTTVVRLVSSDATVCQGILLGTYEHIMFSSPFCCAIRHSQFA